RLDDEPAPVVFDPDLLRPDRGVAGDGGPQPRALVLGDPVAEDVELGVERALHRVARGRPLPREPVGGPRAELGAVGGTAGLGARTDRAGLPPAEGLPLDAGSGDVPVDIGVADLVRVGPPFDLGLVEAVQAAGEPEVGRVLELDRLVEGLGAHQPEDGTEDLGAMEPGPGGHALLDPGRPQTTGVIELPRLDEPGLARLERGQRATELV